MKFTKVREVRSPERANQGDAGIDFFIPYFTVDFINALFKANSSNKIYLMYQLDDIDLTPGDMVIVLMPHSRILIPSGIHVKLDPGTMMDAKNKSGVAHKLGLDIMAQLVDESYQGEVHLSINNTSNYPVFLKEGMKLIQFVISKYESSQLKHIADLKELYDGHDSSRGDGGFGSSNV